MQKSQNQRKNAWAYVKSGIELVNRRGHLKFWMGLCFMGIGSLEIIETIATEEIHDLGLEHAVVLMGILHVINGLGDLVEDADKSK
jgi:hypothetical protein